MSPREKYESAVALLGARGLVEVRNYPEAPSPYRYAYLEVRVAHADVPSALAGLGELAVAAGAYLVMNVHRDDAVIGLSVSCPLADLDPAQIGGAA